MGFYDAKGYWRSDGDGFYDSKGNWVSPGGAFYDGKGYLRTPGDGFYDSKGNWVSPGGAFYDGKGYLRTTKIPTTSSADDSTTGVVVAIGFILFIPIALLWIMTISIIEWIVTHLYVTFIGYVILDIVLCLIITKIKRYQHINFALSFIGNYICLLSFIYIILIYAVPYVTTNEGSFESFFEFTLVLALSFGGIAVIQFFNYYHEKAVLEFIVGILFFVAVIILLKNSVTELYTTESLAQMYHLKSSTLFKVLFGFAIQK